MFLNLSVIIQRALVNSKGYQSIYWCKLQHCFVILNLIQLLITWFQVFSKRLTLKSSYHKHIQKQSHTRQETVILHRHIPEELHYFYGISKIPRLPAPKQNSILSIFTRKSRNIFRCWCTIENAKYMFYWILMLSNIVETKAEKQINWIKI